MNMITLLELSVYSSYRETSRGRVQGFPLRALPRPRPLGGGPRVVVGAGELEDASEVSVEASVVSSSAEHMPTRNRMASAKTRIFFEDAILLGNALSTFVRSRLKSPTGMNPADAFIYILLLELVTVTWVHAIT